ncbi:MAG: hypothetical protein RIR00_95, partial [Pseudomonadota bacterium]
MLPASLASPFPSRSPRQTLERLRQLTALVVEPDAGQRWNLVELSGRHFGRVLEIADAGIAWESLQQDAPDVVLLGLDPEDRDAGLALAARIKHARPLLPLILCTEGDDAALLLRTLELGSDGFLARPVRPEALQSALLRVSQLIEADLEHRLMAGVFGALSEAIMITDAHGCILEVNPAFEQVTGYCREQVLGRKPALLNSGRHDRSFFRQLWQTLYSSGHWEGEIWNRHRNGEVYAAWMTIDQVADAQGQARHFVAAFNDISERKEAEEHIRRLAHYDPLTQLPNRTLFDDRLGQALIAARRHQNTLALMFIDLDRFKQINDTLGHEIGDQLLIAVSQRLQATIRACDTISRHGGDEFLVLLPEVRSDLDAMNVARKLLARLGEPLELDGHQLVITSSIGVAIYPQDGLNAAELIRAADLAMYRAKQTGRNNAQFFDIEFCGEDPERQAREAQLRQALQRGEFELHYLPLVARSSGGILGVEALLRWRHPQEGLLLPGRFLRLAEESGLIAPINAWVLQEAIRQAARWRDAGVPPLRVSINLPEVQLRQPDFVSHLAGLLQQHQLDGAWLELELTEL